MCIIFCFFRVLIWHVDPIVWLLSIKSLKYFSFSISFWHLFHSMFKAFYRLDVLLKDKVTAIAFWLLSIQGWLSFSLRRILEKRTTVTVDAFMERKLVFSWIFIKPILLVIFVKLTNQKHIYIASGLELTGQKKTRVTHWFHRCWNMTTISRFGPAIVIVRSPKIHYSKLMGHVSIFITLFRAYELVEWLKEDKI